MAGSRSLVLRPWIRELVLGSETFSGPRAGQLLEVLQEAQAPSPPLTPGVSFVGAALLVSDGTHSIRCRLTGNALNTSDWEKEFGFRGTEGRLLLLQDCGVRVQVAEDGAPTEFYLQVDRFSLLPMEQPRVRVAGCNQDPDVKKKLSDCLEEYLSEPTSPSPGTPMGWPVTLSPHGVTSPATTSSISPLHLSHSFSVSFGSSPGPLPPGLTLSQLLSEVPEDQEHREALVHLAESCLLMAGPLTAPPITRWAASRRKNMGDTVYTVPSLWLHISENDQQILSSLGPGRELPPPDSALQDLSLTLTSSPSSGTPPELPGHTQSEESSASINLLPALSLVTADLVQRDSSQSQPVIDSTPGPSCSLHPSSASNSTFLSCTSSLLSLDHVPHAYQAHVTRAQKPSLEFKGLGLPPQNQTPSSRTSATKEALAPSSTWDSPKRHRDGSAFQYEYSPPCTSLCAQVQAARLPPELVAWALHFLTEPSPESELTQV